MFRELEVSKAAIFCMEKHTVIATLQLTTLTFYKMPAESDRYMRRGEGILRTSSSTQYTKIHQFKYFPTSFLFRPPLHVEKVLIISELSTKVGNVVNVPLSPFWTTRTRCVVLVCYPCLQLKLATTPERSGYHPTTKYVI